MSNPGPLEISFGFVPVAAGREKKPPTRILLLKDGDLEWAGMDLELDEEHADKIIAGFEERGTQLPIDYHHSTLKSEKSGGETKAPAAGWIGGLEYVPGEGLYAVDVEWTDEAAAEIVSRAYKYISPVIDVRKGDNKPIALHSVALTNRPRTKGMRELLEAAERVAEERSKQMTTATKDPPRTRKAAQDDVEGMGLSVTPEQEAMVRLAELLRSKGAQLSEAPTIAELLQAAIDAIGPGGGETEEEEASAEKITAELGLNKGADMTTVCAEIAKLKTKAGQHDQMAERLSKLEKSETERVAAERKSAAQSLVDEQVEVGKLLPDAKEAVAAALQHAERDPEGFKTMFAGMKVICPPGRMLDTGGTPDGRARIIADASAEYRANPRIAMGADEMHYVDASLRDEGLAPLTEPEIKKLKGGD